MPINQWMAKENNVYTQNGVLFISKEEWNYVICRKMNKTRDHFIKQNKSDSKINIECSLSYEEPNI
jgi:hypothetical protein